jgi:hypothetical protein
MTLAILSDDVWSKWTIKQKIQLFNCWFLEPTQRWDQDQGTYIKLAERVNRCSFWN